MATRTLTNGNDLYTSNLVPQGSETGNSIYGRDGNDQIYGNQYDDFIFGENGNDRLDGQSGNDTLSGGAGTDYLYGGAGRDWLYGDGGSNHFYGGAGRDVLVGGDKDDTFYFSKADGIDTISAIYGADPGFDILKLTDILLKNVYQGTTSDGNSLFVTDKADMVDGVMNYGVIIEDYFVADLGLVDQIVASDQIA